MSDDTVVPMTAVELRAAVERARADGREEGKREVLTRLRDLLATTEKLRRRSTDAPKDSVDEELEELARTVERRRT